jgi:hypothetical protein
VTTMCRTYDTVALRIKVNAPVGYTACSIPTMEGRDFDLLRPSLGVVVVRPGEPPDAPEDQHPHGAFSSESCKFAVAGRVSARLR